MSRCAGAVKHRPRSQEQARLEARMVYGVENRTRQAIAARAGIRLETVNAHAEPQADVTDLPDGVECHQPLGVGLPQSGQCPDEKRSGACQGQENSPDPQRRRHRQKRAEKANQPIDSQFHERAGERGAHPGRRHGWASGSQSPMGRIPAFVANPRKKRKMTSVRQERLAWPAVRTEFAGWHRNETSPRSATAISAAATMHSVAPWVMMKYFSPPAGWRRSPAQMSPGSRTSASSTPRKRGSRANPRRPELPVMLAMHKSRSRVELRDLVVRVVLHVADGVQGAEQRNHRHDRQEDRAQRIDAQRETRPSCGRETQRTVVRSSRKAPATASQMLKPDAAANAKRSIHTASAGRIPLGSPTRPRSESARLTSIWQTGSTMLCPHILHQGMPDERGRQTADHQDDQRGLEMPTADRS